jgi:hypothetical protein
MRAMFDNKIGNYQPEASNSIDLYGSNFADSVLPVFTENSVSAEPSVTPSSAKSKRERRVEEIGLSVDNLESSFREVFKHPWKVRKDSHGREVDVRDKHGKKIPVSNLQNGLLDLRLNTLDVTLKDDKTILVIACDTYNSYKRTTHRPEIAIYRTTVKDPWNPSMKGKVFCDCEAFQYNLAYPNHQIKNLRNYDVTQRRIAGSVSYAANTLANPGPARIRNPGKIPAACKHLTKLWRYIEKDLERIAKLAGS